MKAHKGWETNRDAQRNAIADMVMFCAVSGCRELKPYREFSTPEKKIEFKKNFDFLVGQGCDPKALVTALQLANTIQVPDAPSSKRVKSLRNQILRVSRELTALQPSLVAAGWEIDAPETEARGVCELLYRRASYYQRRLRIGTCLSGRTQKRVRALIDRMLRLAHDLAPTQLGTQAMFFVIQNWRRAPEGDPEPKPLKQHLRELAEDFEDWLRMAKEGGLPRSDSLMRVKRVCPVLYVKWATRGHPFHERVANLLSIVKNKITKEQLSREVTEFEENCPYASDHIRMVLSMVHLRKKRYRVQSVKPYRVKAAPVKARREEEDFLIRFSFDRNGEIVFAHSSGRVPKKWQTLLELLGLAEPK